jgi:hypothetical protein
LKCGARNAKKKKNARDSEHTLLPEQLKCIYSELASREVRVDG